jgi:hypothetical protein
MYFHIKFRVIVEVVLQAALETAIWRTRHPLNLRFYQAITVEPYLLLWQCQFVIPSDVGKFNNIHMRATTRSCSPLRNGPK